MKEVRLCWRKGSIPAIKSTAAHCGPWLAKSPETLKILGDLEKAGCIAFGPGSHWIAEREL